MTKRHLAACFVAAVWAAAVASEAAGACTDRPGTPDNVSVQATSATSLRFNWRITTRDGEDRYYDLQVFKEIPPKTAANPSNVPKKELVRNLTGVRGQGPYFRGHGGMDYYDFAGLEPGTKYCVWVAARDKPGTDGCTSAVHSLQPCVTTPSPPKPGEADVRPGPRVGPLLDPSISVQWLQGDIFVVTGRHFTPNAHVFLKVTGQTKFATIAFTSLDAKSPRRRPITANSAGEISGIRLSGVCNTGRPGDVSFVANDPTKKPTKPVTQRCRGGADPTDINTKIKPKP